MKLLFVVFTLIFIFPGANKLTGRWETKVSEKGNITRVVFKADSIMEGYVNKKPFVSGTYSFNEADSIISFVDNGCNGMRAKYKILFFSNSDSMRFKVITDSCVERSNGMQRLVMGKLH